MGDEAKAVVSSIVATWREFLQSFDTVGGHVILLMLAFFVLCRVQNVQGIDQYRAECVGALLYALKASGQSR